MSQQLVFGDGASILLAGARLPYLTEIQLAFFRRKLSHRFFSAFCFGGFDHARQIGLVAPRILV